MDVKALCREWLATNFKIESVVENFRILPQKYLDRALEITVVEFDFITKDGSTGSSVAFFDTGRLNVAVESVEDVVGLDTERGEEEACYV